MIEPRYKRHMTQAMLNYIDAMNDTLKDEKQLCEDEIRECQALIDTSLPGVSAFGLPIVNGSISQMRELQRYWKTRLMMLERLKGE